MKSQSLAMIVAAVVLVVAMPMGLLAVVVVGLFGMTADACAGGAGGPAVSVVSGPVGAVEGWSAEQTRNAALIVNAGVDAGVSQRDQTIAVMVAIAESSLQVLDYGDQAGPDSRGLFQQRDGWGTLECRMDAACSAGLFYAAELKVPGKDNLAPGEVATRVQINAGGAATYTPHWQDATRLVTALTGADSSLAVECGLASGQAQNVLQVGRTQIGLPYAWGGGTYDGPGPCIPGGLCEGEPGFDCSGFARWAMYNGAGIMIEPRTANDIYYWGIAQGWLNVGWHGADQLQAGQLVFFADAAGSRITHIAIANGESGYLESRTGGVQEDGAWTEGWMGVLQPPYADGPSPAPAPSATAPLLKVPEQVAS